jgi:alkanesulfonate monooxygenase SsuD/methylene tetrahydromethanopterin reductase-like flavin-dependent oxidoreductase (luciferase family)
VGKTKFGIFLPFYAFQNKDIPAEQKFRLIREIALESERLGYDSVWLDDHLMFGDWSILECWTTLSALAALTRRIRLGTMVSCNQHRNPALLAKTAATLDVLSDGRLEFGIGAGVQENEHLAYGFDFPKPSVRIKRLGEALEVLTLLWTQKKANYQGRYYSLKDAVCEPKPIQNPYPPITVGGSGEKMLQVTAKYADRFDWGFVSSIEQYKRKLEALEGVCKARGRDFSEIERSCWPAGQLLLALDQTEINEKITRCKPKDVSQEDYRKYALAATPSECRERLQVYSDLEVTSFMLFFADLPRLDSLRLFAKSVMEKL